MPLSRTCLFRLDDASLAADMVHKHLTWASPRAADNLVSWTKLAADGARLRLFYRHARFRETLDDISLLVADTPRFLDRTFISDLDLIRAFLPHSDGGAPGRPRRAAPPPQQAQRLGGLVPLWRVPEPGLARTQPAAAARPSARAASSTPACWACTRASPSLRAGPGTRKDWASLVVELREPFYARPGSGGAPRRQVFPNDAQSMGRIASLFGVGWRAPVAVALLALAPNRMGATDLLLNFRLIGPAWDAVLEECSDAAANVNSSNMLPEVTEFQHSLNDAYLRFCEIKVGTCIDSVIDTLQVAQQFITTIENTRHRPRSFGRVGQRAHLFDLVRALGGVIEKVFPDKSTSDEAGGANIEGDA